MRKSVLDFWVGLFVLVGIIALLFLALKAGNMSSFSFAKTYQVKAAFDNIGGLKVRAPVKSSGVVVGRVSQILFDDKSYQAIAVLDMDQRYQFPRDSSAKVLTSGLLGEQYIGIEPGGDSAMLASGSKMAITQSAVVLANLTGQFLYSEAADAGAGSANGSAGGTKPAEGSGSTKP